MTLLRPYSLRRETWSLRFIAVLLVCLAAAGCVTTSPSPGAADRTQAGSTFERYRAAAARLERDPDNPRVAEQATALARRHVKEYLAGEKEIPRDDLWSRLAYLRAYPRTGLVFDSDVEFQLKERERQVAQIERKVVLLEELRTAGYALTPLAELTPYEPYCEKLQRAKAKVLEDQLDDAARMRAVKRLHRLAEIRSSLSLPEATEARLHEMVEAVLDQARTSDLDQRLRRLARIRDLGATLPEVRLFDQETRAKTESTVRSLDAGGQPFEAARLSLTARKLWPDAPLFHGFLEHLLEPAGERALARAMEMEAADADRPATPFVYALSALRLVPSARAPREEVLQLGSRLLSTYAQTLVLKEKAEGDEFLTRLKWVLSAPPVLLVSKSETDDRASPQGILSVRVRAAKATVADTQETREPSTYEDGVEYKSNPEFDRLYREYEAAVKEVKDARAAAGGNTADPQVQAAGRKAGRAHEEMLLTPQKIQVPLLKDYTYKKTVHRLQAVVEVEYTITDSSDGRRYVQGSLRDATAKELVALTGVHAKDSQGLKEAVVNAHDEAASMQTQFLDQMAALLAERIREEVARMWLREAERDRADGRTDDAREKVLAYRFLEPASRLAAVRGARDVTCRGLGLRPVPAALARDLSRTPAASTFDARPYEWSAVVKETAAWGRDMPEEHAALAELIDGWDPTTGP